MPYDFFARRLIKDFTFLANKKVTRHENERLIKK